ncbi:MAG: histidine phosphatase family protein [Rhodocyclaceae bacterium]|nr:histidine phosphatase family protein [Rhodocyclaceae bacterium]
MRLFLIRHPQPEVAEGLCYGRADLPLRQPWSAEAVLNLLPPGLLVVSSPLRRCAEFAAALSSEYRIDPRLTELDFGAWEMQDWDALPRAALDAWAADPLGFVDHGGESVAQMRQRVRALLAELEADGRDCVWVTHAGVMKLVLAELLGLPQDEWLALRFAHAEPIALLAEPATRAGSRWSLQPLR